MNTARQAPLLRGTPPASHEPCCPPDWTLTISSSRVPTGWRQGTAGSCRPRPPSRRQRLPKPGAWRVRPRRARGCAGPHVMLGTRDGLRVEFHIQFRVVRRGRARPIQPWPDALFTASPGRGGPARPQPGDLAGTPGLGRPPSPAGRPLGRRSTFDLEERPSPCRPGGRPHRPPPPRSSTTQAPGCDEVVLDEGGRRRGDGTGRNRGSVAAGRRVQLLCQRRPRAVLAPVPRSPRRREHVTRRRTRTPHGAVLESAPGRAVAARRFLRRGGMANTGGAGTGSRRLFPDRAILSVAPKCARQVSTRTHADRPTGALAVPKRSERRGRKWPLET